MNHRRTPIRATKTVLAASAAALALLLGGCAQPGAGGTAAAGDTGVLPAAHVHGIARNPADGKVYLATHDGLFRYGADGSRRVGPVIDLMGFTVAGPNHFYASGHPGQGVDLPQPAGLLQSRDGGTTWQVLSRGGQSDFHALTASPEVVVGYDDTLRTTTNGTAWQERTLPAPPRSLALSHDGKRLVATTEAGVLISQDNARTWAPLTSAPLLLLVAWADPTTLVGVTPTGTVAVSTDAGLTWQPGPQPVGQPQALAATRSSDGTLEILAVTRDAVLRSTDNAATFSPLGAG